MRIVLYFDEREAQEAKYLMAIARAEDHKITWASGPQFNPRDVEKVDEIWTLGEFPNVRKAYDAVGIAVVNKKAPAKIVEPELEPEDEPEDEDKPTFSRRGRKAKSDIE